GRSPLAAAPVDTGTPLPPTGGAHAPRSPHPTAKPPAAVHTQTRAPASPRVGPSLSSLLNDPAGPSASRAAWSESPVGGGDQSAYSAPAAPGAARTPAPSWSTPPQRVARRPSWPRPAPRPRLAAPCRGPPARSARSPADAASAAGSPGGGASAP